MDDAQVMGAGQGISHFQGRTSTAPCAGSRPSFSSTSRSEPPST